MPVSVNDLDANWLTYLEALRKLVDKINEIIGVVNNFNGYGEDVSNKMTIYTIDADSVDLDDGGKFYTYTITITDNPLENPSLYNFWLYNDTQGILVPLTNNLAKDNTLLWFDVNAYSVDQQEFLNDCMLFAKRLVQ